MISAFQFERCSNEAPHEQVKNTKMNGVADKSFYKGAFQIVAAEYLSLVTILAVYNSVISL